MMKNKKLFYGILVIVIILVGGWWIWNGLQKRIPEFKTCSVDSDCVVVGTIMGLEHIPTTGEGCGCKCVTAINKKFLDLWKQKQDEFRNVECLIQCKPCGLDETNSIAKCENNQCVVKPKREVTITTDKTEYEQGETVKVITKNSLNEPVFLESCNPIIIELKNEIKWEELNRKFCEENYIKAEINLGESKIVDEYDTSYFLAGVYRLKLIYFEDCTGNDISSCSGYKTIYSNEFTIKETKGICGPTGVGPNHDVSYCDKSCTTDDDCKFTCGCGAINKNEICHDEGIMYGCVDREVKCEKGKCVAGEEIS